jgi:hypothetical protein
MEIRKTLIAGVALAITIAFSPVQAATLVGPSSQPGSENLAQPVKMKHHRMHRMHGMHRMHRRHMRYRRHHMAMSHRGCGGAYMYRKGRKCMDARNK